MFEDDVKGVIDENIDGICVPKVDELSDIATIDSILKSEESKYGL